MLAVPFRKEQIAVAQALHDRLTQWSAADAALDALRTAFPAFTFEASLLKVAVVNQLYGTNVYAVTRMARHASDLLGNADTSTAGPDLVERLAALPPLHADQKRRTFLSFASKFAHFFIDTERFPIYDSYALNVVRYHIGRTGTALGHPYRYRDYVTDLALLRDGSGLVVRTRELDRYLWLAGEYRAYLRGRRDINTEVKALFGDASQAVRSQLAVLAPYIGLGSAAMPKRLSPERSVRED